MAATGSSYLQQLAPFPQLKEDLIVHFYRAKRNQPLKKGAFLKLPFFQKTSFEKGMICNWPF
jgi:hypothetical protein